MPRRVHIVRSVPRAGVCVAAPLEARLPRLVGVRCDVAAILHALRVMIVGVGSVGQRIVEHLARLQVGESCWSTPNA